MSLRSTDMMRGWADSLQMLSDAAKRVDSVDFHAARMLEMADEIDALRKRCEELEARRERFYDNHLEWRGIYRELGDTPCKKCGGSGIATYGSTSTWRGGIGGQAITSDVCDKCWGSGNEDKPWRNLRATEKTKAKP